MRNNSRWAYANESLAAVSWTGEVITEWGTKVGTKAGESTQTKAGAAIWQHSNQNKTKIHSGGLESCVKIEQLIGCDSDCNNTF